MGAWRSKCLSTIGELFFAWEDDGRDEGFLDEVAKAGVVRRIGAEAGILTGLLTRCAVASGAGRSPSRGWSPCRGWRDEWRELELGV